ncbi:hypothetical protein HYPSUDRAFT_100361, partial [Hypholoma sublateritium FD-334 SS-4]
SYQIQLPPRLKQRGIHDVFHAALLRVHIPNDDRLFPGRDLSQLEAGSDAEHEWAVDRILGHSGRAAEAYFRIQWKAGDVTWLPYSKVHHLNAFKEYLDLQNVSFIQSLP